MKEKSGKDKPGPGTGRPKAVRPVLVKKRPVSAGPTASAEAWGQAVPPFSKLTDRSHHP